jgi:hypothetical protein
MTYGVDVVPFERYWKRGMWKAVLGLCIGIENNEKFETEYEKAIEKILIKNGIKSKRHIHSSFSINRLSKDPLKASQIFEDMFETLKDHIQKFHFVLSMYPKTQSIHMFGERRVSFLPPKDFLERHLIESYPHVCAWKILSIDKKAKVITDSFSGYVTNAWRDIDSNGDLEIFFNGDECNTLISMADMVLRVADKRLQDNSLFLGRKEINQIFPEIQNKLSADFLAWGALSDVTPLINKSMPIYKKIKHPIVFIIGPQTDLVDNELIKYSPLGDSLLEFAHIKKGCLKMFHKKDDQQMIKDGDYFVYLDDEGKKAADLIKKLGFSIDYFELKEIEDRLQYLNKK